MFLLLQTSLRMWLWFPCLLLLHPSSSHPFAVPWVSCLEFLLFHAGCHTGVPKASRLPPWMWDGIYNMNLFMQWVSWPCWALQPSLCSSFSFYGCCLLSPGCFFPPQSTLWSEQLLPCELLCSVTALRQLLVSRVPQSPAGINLLILTPPQ